MKKVAIASYTPFIKNIDDEILKKYLLNAGVNVDTVSWDDKKYDWKSCSFVMIRSTWLSFKRLDEYKEWLDYLEKNNIKVLNDVSIIKSNIFKEKQIAWIKENNIPIMDCEIFSRNDFEYMKKPEKTLLDTIKKYFCNKKKMYILKPTFSAMSNDTYVIDPYKINKDETYKTYEDYEAKFEELLDKYTDRGIILQEFSTNIKNGEYGLSFLNGKFAVAAKKLYGVQYGKNLKDVEVDPKMIEFATNIVNKLPKNKVSNARIDVIVDNGEYKVMELELADADLYMRRIDGFPFWLDDEMAAIDISYEQGCHEKIMIDFVNQLLEEENINEKS